MTCVSQTELKRGVLPADKGRIPAHHPNELAYAVLEAFVTD